MWLTKNKLQNSKIFEVNQSILDSIPALIFFKDNKNQIIHLNRAFAEVLGIDRKDVEGKSCHELFPGHTESHWLEDNEIIETGKPKHNIIEPIETKQGTRWFKTDKIPYYDSSKNITGIICFSVDITAYINTEKELKKSEEKFRLIAENAPDYVAQIDENGKFTYINRTDGSLSVDEMTGDHDYSSVFSWLDKERLSTFRKGLSEIFENKKTMSFESYVTNPNGKRKYLSINISPVAINSHVPYAILIARDLTSHRKAEEAMKKAHQHLAVLNERKSAFVANVSHEFKNPLSVINEGLELMIERIVTIPEKQDELLQMMHKSVGRLTRLVTDLLDITRIESGKVDLKYKEIHLEQIIESVTSAYSCWISKKKLNLITNISDSTGIIMADKDRLYEVFLNLFNNAVKHTPTRGSIVITARGSDDEVRIEFCDTGPGINEKDKKVIFDMFEQVDSEKDGSGLGLPIVKEIVKLHKGKVWVESKPKEGSIFIITLPRDPRQLSFHSDDGVSKG